MKKSRSTRIEEIQEAKNWRSQELQEPRTTTRTTSNTSQSSIPPYSTNPSQLLPSLYNSSRTFEPIQTFYNFLIYITLLCFHKI